MSWRYWHRLISFAIVVAMALLSGSCSKGFTAYVASGINILPYYALSPDGRTIAFSENGAIGLYDWRTDKLDIIPPFDRVRYLASFNYSPDGRKLVAETVLLSKDTRGLNEIKLAVIDLSTRDITFFETGADRYASRPVFRPDGKAILYLAGRKNAAGTDLTLFDLTSRTSQMLLSEHKQLYSITHPSFISNDTVLFVGRNPKDLELTETVQKLGVNPTLTSMPYFLRIGSKPEAAYPDIVRREATERPGVWLPSMRLDTMLASGNGERVVFIPSLGLFQNGLLISERGQIRHEMSLGAFCIGRAAISWDGSTGAFGITNGDSCIVWRGPLPPILAMVDLNTAQVTRIDYAKIVGNFRGRVAKDPRVKARAVVGR